jgi:hypothetical protein
MRIFYGWNPHLIDWKETGFREFIAVSTIPGRFTVVISHYFPEFGS